MRRRGRASRRRRWACGSASTMQRREGLGGARPGPGRTARRPGRRRSRARAARGSGGPGRCTRGRPRLVEVGDADREVVQQGLDLGGPLGQLRLDAERSVTSRKVATAPPSGPGRGAAVTSRIVGRPSSPGRRSGPRTPRSPPRARARGRSALGIGVPSRAASGKVLPYSSIVAPPMPSPQIARPAGLPSESQPPPSSARTTPRGRESRTSWSLRRWRSDSRRAACSRPRRSMSLRAAGDDGGEGGQGVEVLLGEGRCASRGRARPRARLRPGGGRPPRRRSARGRPNRRSNRGSDDGSRTTTVRPPRAASATSEGRSPRRASPGPARGRSAPGPPRPAARRRPEAGSYRQTLASAASKSPTRAVTAASRTPSRSRRSANRVAAPAIAEATAACRRPISTRSPSSRRVATIRSSSPDLAAESCSSTATSDPSRRSASTRTARPMSCDRCVARSR